LSFSAMPARSNSPDGASMTSSESETFVGE
jgi:hypothetical protein